MRVAFLNQPWDTGVPPEPGESIAMDTWAVARRLAHSCDVLVCARRGKGQPATVECEGVRYLRFPLTVDRWLSAAEHRLRGDRKPGSALRRRHLLYAVWAARATQAQACDVVHIRNFSQFVPVVRWLNPQAKIVLQMHCDWLAQLDRQIIDARLRRADAIIGCSDSVTNKIRARFPHHANRCLTIHNGVDVEDFSPGEGQPSRPAGKHIVYVGRISPEKGLHVLLPAFERVLAQRPDASLEIIGPEFVAPMDFIVNLSDEPTVQGLSRFYHGRYLDHLRQQLRGPLLGRVSFAGALSHHKVMKRLREADICVVPSVWSEPFGLPVVEAMATGLPVVASRVGGIRETVLDGDTGLLVEPDNPSVLAEALLRLLEDTATARAMGRAGRQRVEQMFSWDSTVETLKRLYASLCSGAHGSFASETV